MADYKTWLWHGLFAALVTWAFSLVLPFLYEKIGLVGIAAVIGWWGYMWRELDQLLRKATRAWSRGFRWLELWQEFVRTVDWLDALLDVAAPALSAAFVAWRWLA